MAFLLRAFTSDRSANGVSIKPVHTVNIETERSKAGRTLKHLLKLNHANHAILFNNKRFHSHMPHILGSAYFFGASSEQLEEIYQDESRELVPWEPSPSEISEHDWRDYLGQVEYERAYLDFFEDQLVEHRYDWKAVCHKFLYEGPHPLINAFFSGLAHPVIHTAYGYELDSRDVAMEGLALAATQYDFLPKYLDDPPAPSKEAVADPKTPLEILTLVQQDKDFDALPTGLDQMEEMLEKHGDLVFKYWNRWALPDPTKQFADSQHCAAALLASSAIGFDFFICHLLTSSHAIRIYLPSAPPEWHVKLVRSWWLFVLLAYVALGRPKVDLAAIRYVEVKSRDWDWIGKQALTSKWHLDAHYVKACRALKEAALTWGDSDEFYIKAAIKFAENFDGWEF